jgi:hypothetical protein
MQMRRQHGSASEAPPPKAHSAAPADLRLHAAVRRVDAAAIRELVDSGLKPVHLNDNRQTPLDVLDSMAIDVASSQLIRSALLHSQNESAPLGYVKPEAFHGSPWGFKILLSGELRGGVNDTKGGTQSLEGKVFFSDRNRRRPASRPHAPTCAKTLAFIRTAPGGSPPPQVAADSSIGWCKQCLWA